ncbi:hypothetical protein CgunFtcFv8_021752 [Champsocephalus gunnari]|uniref:Uncharacterized protein n=1 Tax=Champsocephalus gunnari TaxID=52237 RepID=A0AAN8DXP6_CHAGU|nr:hypothetical protein CgunFtcFv8_021752 [Champsocephalus gunnari]
MGRTLRDTDRIIPKACPGASVTPREPRSAAEASLAVSKGKEGYWTGGVGERCGPTAVCLIASPHKRAFKAFPSPPPMFDQIRAPLRRGSAGGQEDTQRGQWQCHLLPMYNKYCTSTSTNSPNTYPAYGPAPQTAAFIVP